MIVTAFITVVFGTINFFLGMLPSADSQNLTNIITSATTLLNYAYAWNFIFPIDTLFSIFLLVLGFEGIIITFRVTIWLFEKLLGVLK